MIEEFIRCRHCRAVYHHYVSGCPPFVDTERLNDREYCPDCKKVILEALEKVPPKVEEFWETTDVVSKEDIETEHHRREEEAKANGTICFRRITVPLFDLVDPDNNNICGIITMNGVTFHYSWWTKKDEIEIRKKMERDLVTGKEVLWRDYESRY